MLRANDNDKFLTCEVPEIRGLEDAGCFDYQPMSNLPRDKQIKLLNSIWSYRRKRRPDETLLKYKARICVDGSQQRDGIDFFSDKIYSPVCQWSSVRLTLILA